jgi:DNA-binding response OmpR family regulator
VHILLATDAQWVLDDVMAALSSPSTSFTVVTNGREVVKAVKERTPDLAILDLQVGTMGGMAITMDLRLDHSSGALPHVPVLMLLDRKADIHLARRSGANGWLIKPLNSLKLRRAAQEITDGGCFAEGLDQPSITDAAVDSTANDSTANDTVADDTVANESANADSLTH